MSLSTIISTVETDFQELEAWLADEAETAASDLLALGGTVAKHIEPALFTALQDGIGAAVSSLGAGADFGEILTTVFNTLEPELATALRSVETNLLNGVASLLAAKASTTAPAT